jgi:glutathione peroxidase
MPRSTILSSLLISSLATMVALAADDKSSQEKPAVPPVLNFKMNDIDGKSVDLAKYQGKVVLMVNVASQCGYTPQYKALEALHEKYADKGLVILGFPANEFGKQEPGSDSEIKEFCTKNYSVKFPMFSKVVVKGEGICPLYKHLTSSDTDPQYAGEVKWNFEKFLISRDGKIVNRFRSKVTPDSDEMVKAVEAELNAKVGGGDGKSIGGADGKPKPATQPAAATQPAKSGS